MKEKGQDKIKQICEVLKNETLEPAKQQAKEIIKAAEDRAEQIILEAKQQAKKLIDESRSSIEQERNLFHSSLAQSSKQSLEALKQLIEQKLFNETIDHFVVKGISTPQIVAKLIDAIVTGIQKEGVSKDFAAIIPKTCSAEEIVRHLTSDIVSQLEGNPISVGSFEGGVKIKLLDKKLTLVITNEEIAHFLKQYVRKDFRKFIFSSKEHK